MDANPIGSPPIPAKEKLLRKLCKCHPPLPDDSIISLYIYERAMDTEI